MAQVVITQANGDTPAIGGLFNGLSFFLVQRLPSRSTFIEKIQSNGGRVVRLEAQADHIIADHFRHDCPAGSISYTFIDAAIRDGELADPDDHLAGRPQGTVREVASAAPGRNTRTPFTAQDDRELWQWVERCKAQGGARVKGNEIYKQLEARNPRHTHQAWRDRYVKKLIDKRPAGVELQVSANAPPSPPTAQDAEQELSANPPAEAEFTDEEFNQLLQQAEDIERIQDENIDDAWSAWTEAFPEHSADSWRAFWEGKVRPAFLKNTEAGGTSEGDERNEAAAPVDERTEKKNDAARNESNQASPNRPQSPGSQKRKRITPTSAKTTYGRKKHRSNGEDVFGQERSDDVQPAESQPPLSSKAASTQVVDLNIGSSEDEDEDAEPTSREALPTSELEKIALKRPDMEQPVFTSELNLAAQKQLDREETFPTSAMNRAVQRQLDQEENFPTSDMNRGAQAQLNDQSALLTSETSVPTQAQTHQEEVQAPNEFSTPEMQRRQEAQAQFDEEVLGIRRSDVEHSDMVKDGSGEVIESQARAKSFGLRDEDEEEDEDELNGPVTLGFSSSTAKKVIGNQMHKAVTTNALTEANLKSQQAEHRPAAMRASDLPEDDEEGDDEAQYEYIKFLSNLKKLEGVTAQQQESALPSLGFDVGVPQESQEIDEVTGLPMSSQQDIDDTFDMVIKWPDSPPQSQRKEPPHSQSQQFETQVVYPALSGVRFDVPHSEQDEAEEVRGKVVYPELPEASQGLITTQQEQDALRFSPYRAVPPAAPEAESSFVLVEDEQPPSSQAQLHEDDIDLSLPEPEGGWDDSSSPAKNIAPISHSQDEIHLSIPEPGSEWDTSSSPSKDVRLRTSQPNINASQQGSGLPQDSNDEHEEVEEEIVHAQQQKVVQVSSTSSSPSSLEEDSQPLPTATAGQNVSKRALETQDIMNAETQLPDFDMPLPPDSDAGEEDSVLDLPSDPADLPSSPQKKTTTSPQKPLPPSATASQSQALSESEIEPWVDKFVTIKKFTQDAVIEALMRTSLVPDLAELVLLDGKVGKFPDLGGVWSKAEDEWLESGNARRLKQLEEKHGWDALEARMKFLEDWREESE